MNKITRGAAHTLSLFALFVLFALGVAVGAAVAQGRARLTVLSNTVSTDARKIGGRVYVPIADVAKAMGWKLKVVGNAISLQPPVPPVARGGNTSLAPAGMATGTRGDEIRAENCRFRVVSIAEVPKYERRYTKPSGEVITAEANEKLVVLDCVLTNATAGREEFCFSRDLYAENTVLFDKEGQSLSPFSVDVAADEFNPPGAYALAGANIRFALVFRVPAAWEPKALVYTIVRYRERGMKKGTDVRVNL